MSDYDVLLRLALARRSPYAFDADAPVPDDALRRVFEVARWAPSSYNEQPWRFVVGRRGDAVYRAIADALKGRNPEWALTAPILGLVLAAETFDRSGKPNAHRRFDAGAAGFGLALAAHAVGLGIHWMAGLDVASAAEALGVPDGFDPVAGFALGVPAPDPRAVVPDDLAERARTPKPRRPLAETVFGVWGEPFLGEPSA
ncbi:nitroreductase family protein [Rubrivirga sp. IMCC45206]|uniref:nitroreductase family protein n=1 Tax=Rubrivirga sp. IMCC45206 TaxID=3391614 RepID=UPI00398FED7B